MGFASRNAPSPASNNPDNTNTTILIISILQILIVVFDCYDAMVLPVSDSLVSGVIFQPYFI